MREGTALASTGLGFIIGKLMVGFLPLSLLGPGSTWGLRALEGYLVPWKEDQRGDRS